MNKRSIKYRDTWAAPGSQLFEALEAGDAKKAAEIYNRCEWERAALQTGVHVGVLVHAYRSESSASAVLPNIC